jgi:predicted GNAT family N-acyltransferase
MDEPHLPGYRVELLPWSSPLRDQMIAIRYAVFVDEQRVPAELELDATDAQAIHALARDDAGEPAGTGRLFSEEGNSRRAHIGRMAVLAHHRGRGCGAAILRALIAHARASGYIDVVLSAQTHAAGFYEKFGFCPVGDVYPDCDIPHRDMLLALSNQDQNEPT